MPRPKKTYKNLDELIKSQPVPTSITDGQVRQMLIQLLLDNPDTGISDPALKRMTAKAGVLKQLFDMNHVKDGEDKLSQALLQALAGRERS